MFTLEGCRWGYAFLQTDGRLSELERISLIEEAVDMYLTESPRRKVEAETYSGMIERGNYGLIGCFGGVEYKARVDTKEGEANIRFLVNEPAKAQWN